MRRNFAWLALALAGCTSAKIPVARMEPAEAMGMLRNDFAVLWDVRDPADVAKTGAAAMAVNVAASEWETRISGVSRDKTVVLYDDGADDPRAERVADALSLKGFRAAVLPGFDAWREAKLPVTPPSAPPAAPPAR